MRRIHWQHLALAATLTAGIVGSGAGVGLADTIAIGPDWSQPTQFDGLSGGSQATPDCGSVAASPNHVLNLASDIPALEVSVQASGGEPTLLIEGPGGQRWCARSMDGSTAKVSGYWEAGPYRVFVGDRSGGQYDYMLSIQP